MSQITALMLCLGAVAIGFLVASICQAARIEDDASVYWHQGKEYGYRMGVEAERRAMAPAAKPAEPFDWERAGLALADTFPADGGEAYDHRLAAQRDAAKAKHPSSWTEAHADRGPWPA